MTQPTTAPYKQLRRPTDDRIVAGVCSGVGRYFGIDPTLVRVGFAVVAVVTWGTALIAYPVMWFLMPEEPRPEQPAWADPANPAWGRPQAYQPPFTPTPAYDPPTAAPVNDPSVQTPSYDQAADAPAHEQPTGAPVNDQAAGAPDYDQPATAAPEASGAPKAPTSTPPAA